MLLLSLLSLFSLLLLHVLLLLLLLSLLLSLLLYLIKTFFQIPIHPIGFQVYLMLRVNQWNALIHIFLNSRVNLSAKSISTNHFCECVEYNFHF